MNLQALNTSVSFLSARLHNNSNSVESFNLTSEAEREMPKKVPLLKIVSGIRQNL